MSVDQANIRMLRALQEATARMGAGQSARFGDLWNEAAWVAKTAVDELQAEQDRQLETATAALREFVKKS